MVLKKFLEGFEKYRGGGSRPFELFLERGGDDQIPNILRNLYSLCLDVFQEILGRMTKIQTF